MNRTMKGALLFGAASATIAGGYVMMTRIRNQPRDDRGERLEGPKTEVLRETPPPADEMPPTEIIRDDG